jgi:hypothetical protein
LLLRKSGCAVNRTQDLWNYSEELSPLGKKGGQRLMIMMMIIIIIIIIITLNIPWNCGIRTK